MYTQVHTSLRNIMICSTYNINQLSNVQKHTKTATKKVPLI